MHSAKYIKRMTHIGHHEIIKHIITKDVYDHL